MPLPTKNERNHEIVVRFLRDRESANALANEHGVTTTRIYEILGQTAHNLFPKAFPDYKEVRVRDVRARAARILKAMGEDPGQSPSQNPSDERETEIEPPDNPPTKTVTSVEELDDEELVALGDYLESLVREEVRASLPTEDELKALVREALTEDNALLDAVQNAVKETVKGAMGTHVRRSTSQHDFPKPAKPKAEKPPTKPKRPKVVVVGPQGSQRADLNKVFGDRLDLTIHSSGDTGYKELAFKSRYADRVVLWTTFMSHSHEDAVRSGAPAERVWRVSGGFNQLKDRLGKVADELEEQVGETA